MTARERLDELKHDERAYVALIAALRAVLELHDRREDSAGAYCPECGSSMGSEEWPCPTVKAIEDALR